MKKQETRDFLIRKIPIEIFDLLEKKAKKHQRSKTQEAIIALENGLNFTNHPIKQPVPFKWKEKITSDFIEKAIKEDQK